jgi:hypothetical protein
MGHTALQELAEGPPRARSDGQFPSRIGSRPISRVIGASLLILLASLAWDYAAWPSYERFLSSFDFTPTPFRDFVYVYYPTAQNFFATKVPASFYVYPPFFALLLSPIGVLPFPVALDIWVALQFVAIGVLIVVPTRIFLRHSIAAALGYVALVSLSQAVMHNFRWGQISTFITAGIFLAAELHMCNARVRSAALFASVIAAKLYPAIIAFFYVLRRDLRYLVQVAVLVAAALAVPLLALGPSAGIRYYQLVAQELLDNIPAMHSDVNSQNLANILIRVFLRNTQDASVWRLFSALCVVPLALGLRFLARVRDWRAPGPWEEPVAFLFLLVPLALESCWPHYFVFLPFCQVLVWTGAKGPRRSRHLQRGFAAVSMMLSSTPLFRLINDHVAYTSYGIPTISDFLLIWPLARQLRPAFATSGTGTNSRGGGVISIQRDADGATHVGE